MTPKISVVIASAAGGEFLFRCLRSLRQQIDGGDCEVIVVDRTGEEVASRIAGEHPEVKLVKMMEGHPGVPELRRHGVDSATGEIVAILEEHCTAPPGWIAAIRTAFQAANEEVDERPLNAIGGPILDDGYPRIRDWVVYFSEYHNFLPPWPPGEHELLNGANVAYRRAVLDEHREVLDHGYWEVVLHPLLAMEGRMCAVPDMGVRHTGPFDFGYYIEQRYLLSRVWGGTQRRTAGLVKRLVYLLAAPLFPFLLLARIAHRVLKSDRALSKFLAALPLLVPVAFAYVWGEWLGYLLGPGAALERVE